MFERFTEPARQVVVIAQEESIALRHMYVGTEHLLLGLLRVPDEIVGPTLETLGVSIEGVRGLIFDLVGVGTAERTSGQIPFTPHAKGALEAGLRSAIGLGNDEIGPAHLLLGLVGDNDAVGARILLHLGAGADRIRSVVIPAIELIPPPSAFPDMDRSWLDFTPEEACSLAKRLAPMASTIRFEVRAHGDAEHTFRVSCRPLGDDNTLRDLVALEASGIRAILDHDGTVRLGHAD